MATARMDVSSFVGKLLEEGLAQHEPEPAGRGADDPSAGHHAKVRRDGYRRCLLR